MNRAHVKAVQVARQASKRATATHIRMARRANANFRRGLSLIARQQRRIATKEAEQANALRSTSVTSMPEIGPVHYQVINSAFGTSFDCTANFVAPDGRHFIFAKTYTGKFSIKHPSELFILSAGRPVDGINDSFAYPKFIGGLMEQKPPRTQKLLYPTLILPSNYALRGVQTFSTKTPYVVLPAPRRNDGTYGRQLPTNFGTFKGNTYFIGTSGLGLFLDPKMQSRFIIARPNHKDRNGKVVFIGGSSIIEDGAMIFKVGVPFAKSGEVMSFCIKPNVAGRNMYAAYPLIKNDAGEPLVLLKTAGKLESASTNKKSYFKRRK